MQFWLWTAVLAPVVEEAVVDSLRRFSPAPEVVQETARVARQRMAEEPSRLREDLKAVNVRVRNAKSQMARMRTPDLACEAELKKQIATGEVKAEALRNAVARGERLRLDDGTVRQRPRNFDKVWKTMIIEQQIALLRQLVERVGYTPAPTR